MRKPVYYLALAVLLTLTSSCGEDEIDSEWSLEERVCGPDSYPCESLANCGGTLPDETVFSVEGSYTPAASLRLGPSGCPRLLFEQEDRVVYAEWDGSEWRETTAATNLPVSSSADQDSSLALSADGQPSVGYTARGSVGFAWRDDQGDWTNEIVVEQSETVEHGVDGQGRPVLLLSSRRIDGDTRYAMRRSDGWNIETIPGMPTSWLLGESMTFDSAGRPHIVVAGYREALFYAHRRGPDDWMVERIAGTGAGAEIASIALDPEDRPHVMHCPIGANYEPGAVRHARRVEGEWKEQEIEYSDINAPACHGLAFDEAGVLHALYISKVDSRAYDLRHARWEGGTWRATTLDTARYSRPAPSLAIEPRTGVMHVLATANRQPEPVFGINTWYWNLSGGNDTSE